MNTPKHRRQSVVSQAFLLCTIACAFFISNTTLASATTTSTTTKTTEESVATSTDKALDTSTTTSTSSPKTSAIVAGSDLNATALEGEEDEVECGSFIEDSFPEPIEDCSNPFNADSEPEFSSTLLIDGQVLLDGEIFSTSSIPVSVTLSIETDAAPFSHTISLFRHDGLDYHSVGFSAGNLTTTLEEGTYTAVSAMDMEPPIMVELPWWKRFGQILFTKAHAYFDDYQIVQTFTFTVQQELVPECEDVCASSVLFLPGIQASRLYIKENDGTEKLLWEPNSVYEDDDVLRLRMTDAGESIESVYVRDVIDYAPQSGDLEDAIYGSFLDFMNTLVASESIKDFKSFAYDWRYDVYDIVADGVQYENERRYIDAVIEDLASDSLSGKVTIVAHSNGGMLGKALLDELEATGRTELVDKFIMIGTPQLGTPKAIGSLLHGTDQGLSYDVFAGISLPVISDAAVRQAARNMPGVYGLLPGQPYFDAANDIITIFDTSPITEVWRDAYGNTLNTQAELDDFLISSVNNRDSVLYQSTNEAIVANPTILSKARETRSKQDTWQPPESVEVTSVVGIGRNTISGFWYEAFSQQICDGSLHGCDLLDIYKPVPIISQQGDQTVMAASAEGVSSKINPLYVDLNRIGDVTGEEYIHKNITESPTVQSLFESLLVGNSIEHEFVSLVAPEYDDQQLLLGSHSPVYLHIEDESGRRTGQLDADTVVSEMPDTEWFDHARSSYVIVPKDMEFTVHIKSHGTGTVTFTSQIISDDDQTRQEKVPVHTLTEDTVITINYNNEVFNPLSVDEDGDGERDYQVTLEGERIDEPDLEVTYDVVKQYLRENLRRSLARPLEQILVLAELFSERGGFLGDMLEHHLLTRFEYSVEWLYNKGRLTESDYEVLLEYVEILKE